MIFIENSIQYKLIISEFNKFNYCEQSYPYGLNKKSELLNSKAIKMIFIYFSL